MRKIPRALAAEVRWDVAEDMRGCGTVTGDPVQDGAYKNARSHAWKAARKALWEWAQKVSLKPESMKEKA